MGWKESNQTNKNKISKYANVNILISTIVLAPLTSLYTELFFRFDTVNLKIWRSGVRSAMHAASQLPGKGSTDVDDAPASAG